MQSVCSHVIVNLGWAAGRSRCDAHADITLVLVIFCSPCAAAELDICYTCCRGYINCPVISNRRLQSTVPLLLRAVYVLRSSSFACKLCQPSPTCIAEARLRTAYTVNICCSPSPFCAELQYRHLLTGSIVTVSTYTPFSMSGAAHGRHAMS